MSARSSGKHRACVQAQAEQRLSLVHGLASHHACNRNKMPLRSMTQRRGRMIAVGDFYGADLHRRLGSAGAWAPTPQCGALWKGSTLPALASSVSGRDGKPCEHSPTTLLAARMLAARTRAREQPKLPYYADVSIGLARRSLFTQSGR